MRSPGTNGVVGTRETTVSRQCLFHLNPWFSLAHNGRLVQQSLEFAGEQGIQFSR